MRKAATQPRIGPFDKAIWRGPLLVWLALSVLLGLTAGLSFLPMGAFNVVAAFAIGGLKGLLIALFFMQLRQSSTQLRVVSAAGLFWLSLLFLLSFADYLTRR